MIDEQAAPLDNDLPEMTEDDLIQVHGRKYHLYDEENYESNISRRKKSKKENSTNMRRRE